MPRSPQSRDAPGPASSRAAPGWRVSTHAAAPPPGSLFRSCESVYRPGHASHRRYRLAARSLRSAGGLALHHRRHRVHARQHLLAAPLPGAARLAGRGGGGRRDGAGYRPGAAARPDARPGGAQGVPCRAPGHRDLLPPRRQRAGAGLRYPDRGDGLRLRRPGELRAAGSQAGARRDRQDAALHRLVAPAADREDVRLRDLRRDPSARGLREARRPARTRRARRLARRGDGLAHRPGDLPPRPGGGLAEGQDPARQAAPARGAARARGVARVRGAAPRRAAQPGAARRGDERHRGAAAGDPGRAVDPAQPQPGPYRQGGRGRPAPRPTMPAPPPTS